MPHIRIRNSSIILIIPLLSGLAACGGDDDAAGDADASPPGPDAGGTPDAAGPGPIERTQAGGWPRAVVVDGDTAYVAIGPRLTIWDVADPTAPAKLGETAPLAANIEGFAVQGAYAYVADRQDLDGHVHVVSLADPAAPAVVKSFRLAAPGEYTAPRAVAASATRLYAADQEHGISVFDLADPANPAFLQLVDRTGVTGLRLVGTRLYYEASGFIGAAIGAFDTAANLADLGETGLGNALGVAITPQHLAVAVGGEGVQVVDVTDLANPVPLYQNDQVQARAVAAGDATAWVTAEDGVHVLDLSMVGMVTKSGPVAMPTEGAISAHAAGGLLAVVTDRGRFLTADVSAPATPSLEGAVQVTLCSDCVAVATAGDQLYVADITGGLVTGRVGALSGVGRAHPGAGTFVVFEDIDVDGDLVYVADWNFGLRVFDVSNPAAPVALGALATPGYPSAVRHVGDRVYLGESTNGGALRVIDVSDPAKPVELGFTLTTKAMAIAVAGELVYVADESLGDPGGLRIFDPSDPAKITLVGQYTGCSDVRDVALTGTVAVLACAFDGFHLVDVSDPAAPAPLAVWVPEGVTSAWSVAADGDRAYLGHDIGVDAVDLTDPAKPTLVASAPLPFMARALAVAAPGRVIVAAALAGVYQLEL
jgi:hypothetical protein